MEVNSEAMQSSVLLQALAAAAKGMSPGGTSKESEIVLQNDTEQTQLVKTLTDFLVANGMKTTDENVKMLMQMLENKIPITPENLKLFNQGIKLFSEGSAEKAAFLIENGINVTHGKANMLEGFVNHETLLAKQTDSLIDSILNLGSNDNPEGASEGILKDELLREIFKPDTPQLPQAKNGVVLSAENTGAAKPAETPELPNDNRDSSVKVPLGDGIKTAAQNIITAARTNTLTLEALTKITERLNEGELGETKLEPEQKNGISADSAANRSMTKADAFKAIYTILDSPSEREEALKSLNLLHDKAAEKEAVTKRLYLPPGSISKQNTQTVLRKLSDGIREALERFEAGGGKEENAAKTLLNSGGSKPSAEISAQLHEIRDSMEFIQQLRDTIYMQMPVLLNGEKTTAELYVFNGKKKRSSMGENISALVAIDTQNLGRFETYILKSGKSLDFQFRLENEEAEKAVRGYVSELNKKMSELGFRIESIMYKQTDESFTLMGTEPLQEPSVNINDIVFDKKI